VFGIKAHVRRLPSVCIRSVAKVRPMKASPPNTCRGRGGRIRPKRRGMPVRANTCPKGPEYRLKPIPSQPAPCLDSVKHRRRDGDVRLGYHFSDRSAHCGGFRVWRRCRDGRVDCQGPVCRLYHPFPRFPDRREKETHLSKGF